MNIELFIRITILILLVFLTYKYFYKKNKSKEEFNTDTEQQIGYNFKIPVSFENKNKLKFLHKTNFEGTAHFEDSRSIRFNKAPILVDESHVYFENPNVNINHADTENIKLTRAKIEYLKQSQDVGNLEDGKLTHLFSSRLSGTNACTSKIWDILVGKDVSPADLCESCCTVRKEQNIQVILNKDKRLSLTMKINPISLSQIQFKVFTPSNLIGRGNGSYTINSLIAYRSNQNMKCRMIFTTNPLYQIQNQNYRPSQNDTVIYPSNMEDLINEDTSSNKNEKWGQNIRYIEWGSFNYNFPLETYTRTTFNVSKILFQVIPDEY